jgi:YD repeat-containing protein
MPGKLAAAQYADAAAAANRALVGTLTTTLEVARPDGAALRYLPVGAASGTVRAVQNTGTDPIRVAPTGTDTIDGGTAAVLVQPGEVGRFQSNGSGAWVHVVDLTSDALLKNTYGQLLPAASSYTYNADGTVATETVAGITTTYTYNTDGSVNTMTRSGVTRTFTYNTDGTIATVA